MMPVTSLAVTLWICVAVVAGNPIQKNLPKTNELNPKQNNSSLSSANLNGGNYPDSRKNVDPKKNIVKKATTTTTTTQKPDLDGYEDYYDLKDYNNDGFEKISENKPTPPPVLGCPEITIVCQQYCENKKYYSGYCEADMCLCYGKIYR